MFPWARLGKARLGRFLCIVDYYHCVIPNFANLVYPFSELAKLCPNKSSSLPWSSKASKAFQEIETAIADAAALPFSHPNVTHLQLVTDASQVAVVAALQQTMMGNQCRVY